MAGRSGTSAPSAGTRSKPGVGSRRWPCWRGSAMPAGQMVGARVDRHASAAAIDGRGSRVGRAGRQMQGDAGGPSSRGARATVCGLRITGAVEPPIRKTMLHFHNGHSLEVWCGKRSALANWTTVPSWVTCHACITVMAKAGTRAQPRRTRTHRNGGARKTGAQKGAHGEPQSS